VRFYKVQVLVAHPARRRWRGSDVRRRRLAAGHGRIGLNLTLNLRRSSLWRGAAGQRFSCARSLSETAAKLPARPSPCNSTCASGPILGFASIARWKSATPGWRELIKGVDSRFCRSGRPDRAVCPPRCAAPRSIPADLRNHRIVHECDGVTHFHLESVNGLFDAAAYAAGGGPCGGKGGGGG